VKECIALCFSNQQVLKQFPTLMFFGSNGGLESMAFDFARGSPWRIVMVDRVAGPESTSGTMPNIGALIEAIGKEAKEQD